MTTLVGQRVMVVEDSYPLALEVKLALEAAGAEVVGPFATVAAAQRNLRQDPPNCGVLDVNLGEGASFDLAMSFRLHDIPFLFLTGYDAKALPVAFADVERLEKPMNAAHLVEAVKACCRSTP